MSYLSRLKRDVNTHRNGANGLIDQADKLMQIIQSPGYALNTNIEKNNIDIMVKNISANISAYIHKINALNDQLDALNRIQVNPSHQPLLLALDQEYLGMGEYWTANISPTIINIVELIENKLGVKQ